LLQRCAQFIQQPRVLVGRGPLLLERFVTLAREPRDLYFCPGSPVNCEQPFLT
jgi:hypothetical protein